MHNGVLKHIGNGNCRQPETPDNKIVQETIFSQWLSILVKTGKRFISWILGKDNSINARKKKARLAQSTPIFTLPADILALIMEFATPHGNAFPPNTSAVCPLFQQATDMFRYKRYSSSVLLEPPIDGYQNGKSGPTQKQEIEILYFIKNEQTILEKTNNSLTVQECFKKLKQFVGIPDPRQFLLLEEMLYRMNAAILEERVRIAKASDAPTKLFCSDCKLTRLPGRIIKLPKYLAFWAALQIFALDYNRLQTLPPEIGLLVSLKEFYFMHNQLHTLPREIGLLTKLQKLSFACNWLQDLPPEIGLLIALQELFISSNRFQSLPAEIGLLQTLKTLALSKNQFQTFPTEIWQLVALESLSLSDNQLQSISSQIVELIALKELYLINNKLQALPDNLPENVYRDNRYFVISKAQVLASQRKPNSADDETKSPSPLKDGCSTCRL